MSVFPGYYFLQSPYTFSEMQTALLHRQSYLLRKHKIQLIRLKRNEQKCTALKDDEDQIIFEPDIESNYRNSKHYIEMERKEEKTSEECTEVIGTGSYNPNYSVNSFGISSSSSSSFSSLQQQHPVESLFRYPSRPLLFYWTDGSLRFFPFRLLQRLAGDFALNGSGHPICLIMGGSLGIESSVLDDKTKMMKLLQEHKRDYIPDTASFSILKSWEEEIKLFLIGPLYEGEIVIVKPSLGLKQKGLLLVLRNIASIPIIQNHVTSYSSKYQEWVIQSFVSDPMCLSGLDLGLVAGSPIPAQLYINTNTGDNRDSPNITSHSPTEAQFPTGKHQKKPTVIEIGLFNPNNNANGNLEKKRKSIEDSNKADSNKIDKSRPKKGGKTKQLLTIRTESSTSSSITAPINLSSIPSDIGSSSTYSYTDMLENEPCCTSPLSLSPLLSPTLSFPVLSSPSLSEVAGAGQLPSDSGRPISCLSLYKIHFRVYALLRYDKLTGRMTLFVCEMGKIYHAPEESGRIIEGKEKGKEGKIALIARNNADALLLPLSICKKNNVKLGYINNAESINSNSNSNDNNNYDSVFVDLRDPLRYGQSISNCLAMRQTRDILSSNTLSRIFPQFLHIVIDSIELGIPHMRPFSPPLTRIAFQVFGFDFLYNNQTDKAVLLEINNNVGQGIHPWKVMGAQGRSRNDHRRMREYWKEEYRKPFCESIINHTVDYIFGKETDNNNQFTKAKEWKVKEGETGFIILQQEKEEKEEKIYQINKQINSKNEKKPKRSFKLPLEEVQLNPTSAHNIIQKWEQKEETEGRSAKERKKESSPETVPISLSIITKTIPVSAFNKQKKLENQPCVSPLSSASPSPSRTKKIPPFLCSQGTGSMKNPNALAVYELTRTYRPSPSHSSLPSPLPSLCRSLSLSLSLCDSPPPSVSINSPSAHVSRSLSSSSEFSSTAVEIGPSSPRLTEETERLTSVLSLSALSSLSHSLSKNADNSQSKEKKSQQQNSALAKPLSPAWGANNQALRNSKINQKKELINSDINTASIAKKRREKSRPQPTEEKVTEINEQMEVKLKNQD